jgi:hypothetical protein
MEKVENNTMTEDLDALLAVLPPTVRVAIEAQDHGRGLLEVVLDLGRRPEARFLDREVTLSEQEVTQEELDYVVAVTLLPTTGAASSAPCIAFLVSATGAVASWA